MNKKIISVTELNCYVTSILDEDYMLNSIWLSAEISNLKYHKSGHIYFTLKDENASINAVMFAKSAATLNFKLADGDKINARCKISLYEKTGAYQAYIFEIEKQGVGTLHESYEALKHKLNAQGLFDNKKPLPKYPQNVGIITSNTAAALFDILNVATRRNKSIPIYIYPAAVQGEVAKDELIQQIKRANRDNIVDVIILARGGGSIEDLWSFNSEELAYAIYGSKIPIISGVGHEIDFTIVDFACDRRAPTPSAAAEIVFPDTKEIYNKLDAYKKTLSLLAKKKLTTNRDKFEYVVDRPAFKQINKAFEQKMQYVDVLTDRLQVITQTSINNKIYEFNILLKQLEKLSPIATLSRGYSYISKDTQIVSKLADVQIGDDINIVVQDGCIMATIINKERKNGEENI
ncbi:MAG: exodeoxyribonuclease VII large subunit [Epulopiscium sp. Nuni2H_MBin003]|nr:MAG: exodeoxyribonuclease VII large subunit [Epulopiscium sp. Nuni2H_MBin003]